MTVKQWKRKQFFRNLREGVKEKLDEAGAFIYDHQDEIKSLAATAAVVVPVGMKIARKVGDARERRFQETHYYDASIGAHIKFRRKPSKRELNSVRDIHEQTGRKYYDIYKEFGLVK